MAKTQEGSWLSKQIEVLESDYSKLPIWMKAGAKISKTYKSQNSNLTAQKIRIKQNSANKNKAMRIVLR